MIDKFSSVPELISDWDSSPASNPRLQRKQMPQRVRFDNHENRLNPAGLKAKKSPHKTWFPGR